MIYILCMTKKKECQMSYGLEKNLCVSVFQYVLGDMLDCHICYPINFHKHCKIYEFLSLLHVCENKGLELVTVEVSMIVLQLEF